MINYETILSLFDDKLTLLQYLTKIEEALKNEQLTDITVTQTDASHVYFTFVFEDGSTIDTPTFTLPAGPQGIQGPAGADGADGVSVTNAEIDASGHLILTLSNGNTIDAGATGLQTVTAGDIDSETATQYELLKADGNGGASWGRATAGDIADNNQVGQYLGSTGYGFSAWKKLEIAGVLVTSGGATAGQVLTADGSDKASWQTIPTQTPEGTAIKSTGETSGKVLTADGSGGASWETAGGGGGTKYLHCVVLSYGSHRPVINIILDTPTKASNSSDLQTLIVNKYKPTDNTYTFININGYNTASFMVYSGLRISSSGVEVRWYDNAGSITATALPTFGFYSYDIIEL